MRNLQGWYVNIKGSRMTGERAYVLQRDERERDERV